ncbi:hypothetical protein Tco_1172916 [Tanacetum coccineum]
MTLELHAQNKSGSGEAAPSFKGARVRTVAVTAEDMQKREYMMYKARTLFCWLSNYEISLDSTNMKTANGIMGSNTKEPFGGNDATKKEQRRIFYESKVQKKGGSSSQNMAFISSSNTNSGKSEVPTAQSFSTASGQVTTVSTEVANCYL